MNNSLANNSKYQNQNNKGSNKKLERLLCLFELFISLKSSNQSVDLSGVCNWTAYFQKG